MKYELFGQNIKITEGIEEAVKKSLAKIDKYFKDSDLLNCRVVVKTQKLKAKVEVTIHASFSTTTIRAEETDDDLYVAIGKVANKVESQINKVKNKIIDRKRSALVLDDKYPSEEIVSVRNKNIWAEHLDLEEAVIKMESLGHTFFLYVDVTTNRPTIVYKRLDEGYGTLTLMGE